MEAIKVLENVSWPMLLVVALLMALAPFGQTPHLFEKIGMLMSGTLRRPLDIFDLFLHATPLLMVAVKAWLQFGR